MRCKVWQTQQETVVLRGQNWIDELWEDVSHAEGDQLPCGRINCLLKSLHELQGQLSFDATDVERRCEALQSSKVTGSIGVAFWSFLMGDADESHPRTIDCECFQRRSNGLALFGVFRH